MQLIKSFRSISFIDKKGRSGILLKVFKVAYNESDIKNSKFKMADPIWRPISINFGQIDIKLGF